MVKAFRRALIALCIVFAAGFAAADFTPAYATGDKGAPTSGSRTTQPSSNQSATPGSLGPGSDWILGDWEIPDGCGAWYRYQSFRREGARIVHYASQTSLSNLEDGGWEISNYDPRTQTWSGPGWTLRLSGANLIVQHEETCTWRRPGAAAASPAPSTSSGAWTAARVTSEAGRWVGGRDTPSSTGGYYMVANTNIGHAGYIGMGSIVTINSCDSVNCQVDIAYGYGSNACDGWYIVPTDLTYLGPSYQTSWQSISDQLIQRDSNRTRLQSRCTSGGRSVPTSAPAPSGSNASIIAQINAIGPTYYNPPFMTALTAFFVPAYDRNHSGDFDTAAEVNAIPCEVYLALDQRMHRDSAASGLDWTEGFAPGYSYVGQDIGFNESMRDIAHRRMLACGVRPAN